MGKRKSADELSENANTKRNREYTARMNEEDKSHFNQQKALSVVIGRAKKKLYETTEFKEAGHDKRLQMEKAAVEETLEQRKAKGKFAMLPSIKSTESIQSKRLVAYYPWDDDDPEWEDLNQDVDETVERDIDEMNGETVNLKEITKDERDRQMRHSIENAHRHKYLKTVYVYWKRMCAAYRKKAKSLKKKLSFLNRYGVDENGDFTPIQLFSHFSHRIRLKLENEVKTQGRKWSNANGFFTRMEIAILVNWAYWKINWDMPVDLPGPACFWDGVKVDHILGQIEEANNQERLRARLAWHLVSDDRFIDHIPAMAYRFPLPGVKPLSGLPRKFQHRFVLHLTEVGVRANDVFPKYEDVAEEF